MTILGQPDYDDYRVELGSPTGGAGTGAREYTATLYVESDDCEDTGHAVLEWVIARGFDYGAKWAFGNDSNDKLRLYQIDSPQFVAGSAYTWRVTLRYKEFKLLVATSTVTIDPTDFLPEIEITTIGRNTPIEKGKYQGGLHADLVDFGGWVLDTERTITNSANTPFIPTLEVTRYHKLITIVRRTAAVTSNEANFPTFWINSVPITLTNGFITQVCPAFELLFTGWSFKREQYEGYDLVRVQFTGELKEGGWREELLDKGVLVDGCDDRDDGRGGNYGSYQDPANVAAQRNLLDRSGIPISEPVLLDGNGNALPGCSEDRFYGLWSLMDEIDPAGLGFFADLTP